MEANEVLSSAEQILALCQQIVDLLPQVGVILGLAFGILLASLFAKGAG
jgi:hypothetical protein